MPSWWTDKEERQYKHIKEQYMSDGISKEEAEERAARTVNKGHSKQSVQGDDPSYQQAEGLPPTPVPTDVWNELIIRKSMGVLEIFGRDTEWMNQEEPPIIENLTKEQQEDLLQFLIDLQDNLIDESNNMESDEEVWSLDKLASGVDDTISKVLAIFQPRIPNTLPWGEDEQEYYRSAKVIMSKWQVTALGEAQQPGGVGATYPEEFSLNPDPTNFEDNADNSYEQEVALKRWVDVAVGMLNRGEPEEVILARLSHDGAPDPQGVLNRAKKQPPEEEFETGEAGEDAFMSLPENPNPPTGGETSETQSVNSMPARMQKVIRVAGTSLSGTVVDEYTDLYDRKVLRVALDDGSEIDVNPENVEEFDEEVASPVSEVQSFIDTFPTPEPNLASYNVHIDNLKQARKACIRHMSAGIDKLSDEEMSDLDTLAQSLTEGIEDTAESMNYITDDNYVNSFSHYEVGGARDSVEIDRDHYASNVDMDRLASEDAKIMVDELPELMLQDEIAVRETANRFISNRVLAMSDEDRQVATDRFLSAVESFRKNRLSYGDLGFEYEQKPLGVSDRMKSVQVERAQSAMDEAEKAYNEASERGASQSELDSLMRTFMDRQDNLNRLRQASSINDGPAEELFI